MRVEIDLTGAQVDGLAVAVVAELERQGKVMVEAERMRPYSVAEAARELGVGRQKIYQLVEAGSLDRVSGTATVRVTTGSLRRMQEGGRI